MRRCDHQVAECDEDSSPESNFDAENWLDWNGDLDDTHESEDARQADDELNTELDNGIEDPENPGQRDVSAAPIVPGSIRPTWR